MKPLDLSNVEAIESNELERIEAGGYVVRIIDIVDNEEKEFLWLVFDIAEGPRKGFYTNENNKDYYKDKPNKHGILISYKSNMSDKAKSILKGRLNLFTKNNPGFDAEAALSNARPDLFIGKFIGLVAGIEEYIYEGREDGKWHKGESIDWFHARMKTTEDIRNGKFKIPETRKLEEDDKAKLVLSENGATITENVYSDIPFDV